MGFTTKGLQAYVEESNVQILPQEIMNKSSVLDKLPNWKTGIKTSATIGIIDVSTDFAGETCSFTDNSTNVIKGREISVAGIQVMGQICDTDLTDYFTGKLIRRTAGDENIDGELYKEFVEAFLGDIRKKNDIAVFAGDTTSADANLNKYDGVLKIVEADGKEENFYTISTGNALSATMLLSTKITGAMHNRGELALFVDPRIQYALAMAHFNACPCQPGETLTGYNKLPNGLEIIPAEGLRGTGKIVITSKSNIVVGTDFANDRETFKFWFSDDNQVWRYIVKFYMGVQVAVPEEVVVGTLSDDVINSVSQGQIDTKSVE